MLKIALTGGIATGKSYVLQQFGRFGVPTLDADAIAHGVMVAGTEATALITARFGPAVVAPDGAVDRARLAPIVFSDAAARRDLEAIVHPAVYRSIAAALLAFERTDGAPLAVVDIPLLYETGHAGDFDRVVVASCAPALQIERLVRRGMNEAEAKQRLAAQWPTADKVAKADFVINTDGPFDETNEQVRQVFEKLRAMD